MSAGTEVTNVGLYSLIGLIATAIITGLFTLANNRATVKNTQDARLQSAQDKLINVKDDLIKTLELQINEKDEKLEEQSEEIKKLKEQVLDLQGKVSVYEHRPGRKNI